MPEEKLERMHAPGMAEVLWSAEERTRAELCLQDLSGRLDISEKDSYQSMFVDSARWGTYKAVRIYIYGRMGYKI